MKFNMRIFRTVFYLRWAFLLVLLTSNLFAHAAQSLRINEFLASNQNGTATATGERTDWIEIRNLTDESINLAGWYLTDSAKNLTKFQFPPTSQIPIQANGYFLLFASGSEAPIVGGQWHANFSLSREGEYLALVRPDGVVEDEFSPAFPEQYTDVSYGVIGDPGPGLPLQYGYFLTPTPRRANGEDALLNGRLPEVEFDQERGFRTNSFSVSLSCPESDTTIYYTLDGSTPTESSSRYRRALNISKTTALRACAFKEGYLPSQVRSRTWIFIDDVLKQSTMRRTITDNPLYRQRIIDGLQDIPSISLTTDRSNLYGSTGIFDNYGLSGIDGERPASVELIDPKGGAEFDIFAGLRIRGAVGRSAPKKSLRLFFNSTYDGNLAFPLFGDEGAELFTKVDLRAEQNNSWSSNVDAPWQNTFIREVFSRDTQRDMGELYTRSRYYHLYINGTYWGLYQSQERGEADFASSYLGGSPKEWDALKSSSSRIIELKDGTRDAYTEFYEYAKAGFTGQNEPNYWKVLGLNPDGTRNPAYPILLDQENLIHYILTTLYAADVDSPLSWINIVNNVNTVYHREEPAGFLWLKHDAELSLGAFLGVEDSIEYFKNATYWSRWSDFNPMDLHRKLMQHPEYYRKFGDMARGEYLGGGALSQEKALQRWNARMETIEQPVVAESARWGNQWGGGYTWETWKSACHLVTDAFMVGREYEMIPILRKHDWYPALDSPGIQPLGDGENSFVKITAADATVYFTLDGSDPRLPDGSLNPEALELQPDSGEPALVDDVVIPARSTWRCYDTGDAPPDQRNHSKVSWGARFYNDYDWSEKIAADGFSNKEVYLRKSFVLESLADIKSASLELLKGSGTVYLNGSVVRPGSFQSSLLRQGRNLLTVAANNSAAGFDLSLTLSRDTAFWTAAAIPAAGANTWVKARALQNNDWSALSEYDGRDLSQQANSFLRVTEMMYSAEVSEEEALQGYTHDDFAWIELQNSSERWMNLAGAGFTEGIEYTFPDMLLAPGAYLVLCKNPGAFATRYDIRQMQLLGPYKGNLARKGETLTLSAADGSSILSYTYSNSWYPETDGGGYSLVVIDVTAEEPLWSTPENWEPSKEPRGTPDTGKDGQVDPPPLYPPVIVKEPANQSVLLEGTATFSVTVTGTAPLQYQWFKDGQPIEGAVNPTYTIDSVSATDAGLYQVTISNAKGSRTSREAELIVKEKGAYADALLYHRYSFEPVYENDKLIAKDSVGGADGTLYGSATIIDSYLSLDGSGDTRSFTNGCFLALPPNLISNFPSFSVEMWVRATRDKGSWMRLFDFGNCEVRGDGTIGNGLNYTMTTWKTGNNLCNGVRLEGVEHQMFAPALPIGDGLFHHIVYVYDAESQTGTLYTDGEWAGVGDQAFNPTQFGDSPNMWIGKSQFGADPYFAGDFDEFRIYEGVLSDAEVALNYELGPDALLPLEPEPLSLNLVRQDGGYYLVFTGVLEISQDMVRWQRLPAARSPWPLEAQGTQMLFYRTTY
ncbi:MAG: lamin tail domain-containing protein [Verrucomicrobiota bacterium]|nr:lamin tail domain-containing protein [Verrucomicrobiota bacterium]